MENAHSWLRAHMSVRGMVARMDLLLMAGSRREYDRAQWFRLNRGWKRDTGTTLATHWINRLGDLFVHRQVDTRTFQESCWMGLERRSARHLYRFQRGV